MTRWRWPRSGRIRLIAGPPGTGKTSAIVKEVGRLLSSGYAPAEIAAVSHTRASTAELGDRICDAYPACTNTVHTRTLHSTCFRLLELDPDSVRSDEAFEEFAKAYSYDLRIRKESDEPQTADDHLFLLIERARHCIVPLSELPGISPADLRDATRMDARYQDFLSSNGLVDFTMMLETALADHVSLPVRAAMIDEAQDLTPLAVRVAAAVFDQAERIVVVGDDDQSLYSFIGARGDWIVDLAGHPDRVRILSQSYRVPGRVFALAQRVVGRIKHRVDKPYAPRAAAGVVYATSDLESVLDVARAASEDTMVVGRTWSLLRDVARRLVRQGIPFACPSRPSMSPFRLELIRAVGAALALARREPISPTSLLELFAQIPSRGSPLPRGVKAKASRRAAGSHAAITTAELDEWGLGSLRDAIRSGGPLSVMTKLPAGLRDYLSAILRREGKLTPPSIILRSIHDAKGLEATHVVLLGDWGVRPFSALGDRLAADDEHRAAYVALTRARERLTIVLTDRHAYPFPLERDRGAQ